MATNGEPVLCEKCGVAHDDTLGETMDCIMRQAVNIGDPELADIVANALASIRQRNTEALVRALEATGEDP